MFEIITLKNVLLKNVFRKSKGSYKAVQCFFMSLNFVIILYPKTPNIKYSRALPTHIHTDKRKMCRYYKQLFLTLELPTVSC